MSENALGYLMNRAGYGGRHVPHGWRATFLTVINERYPEDWVVIDLMLAHLPAITVEAAYNRAERLDRRQMLSQAWADLLSLCHAFERHGIHPRRLGRSSLIMRSAWKRASIISSGGISNARWIRRPQIQAHWK